MSKDEVLGKLGEPEAIQLGDDEVNVVRRGEEKYSLNDLPSHYILIFRNLSFWMTDESIEGISVHSPLYKLSNGVGAGDSEQKIIQAFGEDFQTKEVLGRDYICYLAKGLAFEIHKKNQTVAEILVYQPQGDRGDREDSQGRDAERRRDGRAGQREKSKVIMLSEQPPGPITFPKIDRKPKPFRWGRSEMKSLPKYDPALRNGFQVDLRGRHLSKLDLRNSIQNLMYADFDDRTVWPASNKMPHGFNWQKFMELGKNPGLGVHTLHERGITGKGVGVAIIDQTLLTEHIEYADSLRLYEENNIRDETRSSMHGPAVASIAVGRTVGVAPDADLYYIASWELTRDDDPRDNFVFRAQAIRRLLEINRQLPANRKIRVISNSIGWSPPQDGYDEITAACEEAKAAGIFVVTCGIEPYDFDFGGLGRHPLANPDSFESYEPCLDWAKIFYDSAPGRDSDALWVPEDSRATASFTGGDEYVFYRQGGASWCAPYIAGIYALAVQVEPEITPERFWNLAMKTGRTIELEHKGEKRSFGPIIDPVRLILSIQTGESATLNRQQSDTRPTETHPQTLSRAFTIVPGVGIGDYTLDMSKDDVLKKLGEPQTIFLGGKRYTLDNLPKRYFMSFDGITFTMAGDDVTGISVYSPSYKFANGLTVGDSEDKIKQAFGGDFEFEEYKRMDALTYKEKGLRFEISKNNRTVTEINVTQAKRNKTDSPKELKTLPKYDPDSDNPFRIDLRDRDLLKFDLSNSIDDLLYASFDDRTVWPTPDRMPSGFDWQKIMEQGKNPGLDVRSLHEKGITGRGVRIAILDQPLLVDHQEYAKRVRLYEEIDLQGRAEPSMHGAAVASIAVGKTVGVAPEAELYYIAKYNFDRKGTVTMRYIAQGIDRILEINEQLPKDNKIRVISISRGWGPSNDGYDDVMAACEEAKAAGIFVVSCSLERVYGFQFHGLGRQPLANPDIFESYEPGLWWAKGFYDSARMRGSDRLLIPMDSRTTASPCGSDKYVFYRQGGWSWSVPYIAGVYALAAQVEPDITPERFWSLAMQTGRTIELDYHGKKIPFGAIIDPVRLIRAIQTGEPVTPSLEQSDAQPTEPHPQKLSEPQIIVPGLRIGGYTVGMTKDDVLRKLGEPKVIFLGEERYTLDNLPRRYFMLYDDISFFIEEEGVTGIATHSPRYKFANGLKVGDSQDRIIQAFG
ncbi:MAG: S8 family serine peptidase [Phycisphaerae bacterium]|nr:S8 family serine peptidase [Phycisphaerae bacterium]